MQALNAVPFDKHKHLSDVQEWAKAWELSWPLEYLPPLGVVVPGIWASFLILTNTPIALIEPTISNPQSTKEERDKAQLLAHILIEGIAKDHGAKVLMGICPDNHNIIERARSHGYSVASKLWRIVDKRIGG